MSKAGFFYFKGLLNRLIIILRAYWKGRRYLETIFYAVVFIPLHYFMQLLFRLDNIFYRDIKNTEVREPIIVIGHPRSGTTSLQNYIAQTGEVAFSTFQTLLFPSILMRKLLTPAAMLFNKFNILDSEKKGHRMELFSIEEDEGLFLHSLNTEILTIFCPWLLLNPETRKKGIRAGWHDFNGEESDMPFFREYLKRQLVTQKKRRVLLKTNPSVLRIQKILKYFPDAKFVYIYRDPVETIPSFFSMHYNFINERLTENELNTYFTHKYKYSFMLYHYFEKISKKIPAEQLLSVEFEELKNDPGSLMKKISDFTRLAMSESYQEYMENRSLQKHQKKHRNLDFSFFGISPEAIKKDFGKIRAKYSC